MSQGGVMTHNIGLRNTRLPLILTKLKAPTDFRHLLLRPRLMDKLIEGIDYRITLIQAPAGFGKTSLAMQWREYLANQNYHVAWLSLDVEDNDPERCINYIVEALRSVEESIEVNTTALSRSRSLKAIKFILIELINQIETLNERIYLILDDWHFISNQAIHDVLNFLIECAPEHFHLIVCSRTQPPIPIYTLYAKHQLYVIDSTALRFDETETSFFLCEINHVNLNHEDIHTLWLKTDGWIASLQLILLMLKTQKRENGLLEFFNNFENIHSVSEYLAENVLDNLPPDTLIFLLKTSILDRLNDDLCNTVTGRVDGQDMLKRLYKEGMFIRPLDQEQIWFQYHHLFAEFLQNRLKRQLPDMLTSLHLAAAKWFANVHQTAEAVNHAILAKEMKLAISWVENDAMWMVEHSFMGTLLRLTDRLPEKSIQMRCELQLAIAWAYCLTHHQPEAQRALDFVELALIEQNHLNERSIRIEAKVLQACIDMYADRLDKIEHLLPDHFKAEDIHNPWMVVVANNVITYVLIHTYRYQEAVQLQKHSNQLHNQTRGPFSGIYGDCFAGIAYLEMCELNMAEQCFKKAQERAWQEAGKYSHAAYLAGALLGKLYYERNQIDDAEILLMDSRTLGVEGGVGNFYIATYCFCTRIAILKSNLLQAHAIIKEGQHVAKELHIPRLDFSLRCELMKLYLLENDISSAENLMIQWHELVMSTERSIFIEHMIDIRNCAEARLLCSKGDYVRAIDEVSAVLQKDIDRKRVYSEIATRTLLAKIMNMAGRYSQANEILLPALLKGYEQGITRTFVDEGQEVMKIIDRLSKQCRQQNITDTSAEFNRWLSKMLMIAKLHEDNEVINLSSHVNKPIAQSLLSTELIIDPLKDKEIHIIKMLEKGLTNKEIAKNLNVSVDTVKWYLKNIYNKLGVSRRTQAVSEAKKLNILIH